MQTKTTKSGKVKQVNLRSHLYDLEIVAPLSLSTVGKASIAESVQHKLAATGQVAIRYVGSCRNDGTLLRPKEIVTMLESVSGQSLVLGHIHRVQLILNS